MLFHFFIVLFLGSEHTEYSIKNKNEKKKIVTQYEENKRDRTMTSPQQTKLELMRVCVAAVLKTNSGTRVQMLRTCKPR